jgi:nucleoside-diphosphate-sugar epimerase
MSSVVVTGAGGFLARPLLAALLRRGCSVHALGRSAPPPGLPAQVHWHRVDLFDRAAIREALGSIRAGGLIHLAWETAHGRYWQSSKNLEWTAASLYLLLDFQDSGGRRAVIAGSSAEYDWTGASALDEELTPLRPASLYGHSKNALREVIEAWAPQAGISWAWGRIFNIYGPFENPERLVPRAIRTLQDGRKFAFDDGALVRDFLHVDDAADAFASLYASNCEGAVNIGSGEPVTIRDVVNGIAECIGQPDLVDYGALPAPADAPSRLVASVGRLRSSVGWSPQGRLRDRLRETCEWWKSNARRTADKDK